MAAEAALEMYELLDNILLHLPLRELLLNQRICKTWKKVIDQSVSAQ